jgi:RHS repeat-associated protein
MGSGGSNQWNEYLFVYGEMVGERVNVINGAKTKFWFHKDHLGSMAALTNGTIGDPNLGSVVERDSYDSWGRQRHTNGTDDAVLTGSITSTVTRGYTGQEELADVSLIHYNGRVYDPLIARFTSPDPVVGQPESSQGWNRYAYVGNNPLAFTDPNGFCGFFCVLSHVFNPIQHFNDALAITRAIYSIPYLGQILNIATVAVVAYYCLPCAPYVASALSALQAGVTSGKIGDAFKAGAIAFAEAEAFAAVGTATGFHGGTLSDVASNPAGFALNVAGHAAIGCVGSVASGGECGAGAAGAGFGAIAAPVLGTAFPHPHDNFVDLMGGTLASAGVGGLGSIAGGRKFENGAVTGAFGYLFNQAGRSNEGGLPPGAAKLQDLYERGVITAEERDVELARSAQMQASENASIQAAARGYQRIPGDWIATPTEGEGGIIYQNPANSGDSVRIMPPNPQSQWPSQRDWYVIDNLNGQYLTRGGIRVQGPANTEETHIPLETYKFNR